VKDDIGGSYAYMKLEARHRGLERTGHL
jgi:hypothetical protein